MNAPRWSFCGPEMVPEAKKSPVRVEAPLTVVWASICAGDQYICPYGGRDTTSPFHATSRSMSRPHGCASVQVGQRGRILRGRWGLGPRERDQSYHPRRNGVANHLPRNGPSGTYSQGWMSRADQSLTSTAPNT